MGGAHSCQKCGVGILLGTRNPNECGLVPKPTAANYDLNHDIYEVSGDNVGPCPWMLQPDKTGNMCCVCLSQTQNWDAAKWSKKACDHCARRPRSAGPGHVKLPPMQMQMQMQPMPTQV